MSDTGLTPADESMKGDTMSDADTVLILRCCRPDGSSHNGFVWPRSGPVEAPDWSPSPECGHGLHGWLWGEGDADASRHWRCDGALWLVVEVAADAVVELGGKVKFQRGHVVRSGLRDEVIPWLVERCPGRAILFGTATAGAGGIATAGDYGTAVAGYRGTATVGEYGTATVGDGGTATAGAGGIATAGDYGTAVAGYHGTATAGEYGTAVAGDGGTATAGECGVICVRWWDYPGKRHRVAVGYIGEGGLEPGKPYRWASAAGEFVEVTR